MTVMLDQLQAIPGTFEERLRESSRFHAGTGKVHQTLRQLAIDLERLQIDYTVVGGMALNAHGYRRQTVDINILVRPEGLEQFREGMSGDKYRPNHDGATKCFQYTQTGVNIKFVTTGDFPGDGKPKPVVFPDPAEVAIELDGIKVVDLPTLINLKLASGMTTNRLRELADVQDLIRVLSLNAEYAIRVHPYVRTIFLQLHKELAGAEPHSG